MTGHSTANTQIRWCADCEDDQVFEPVQCDDSPTGMAELCCAMCGLGVFDSVLVAIVDETSPEPARQVSGAA